MLPDDIQLIVPARKYVPVEKSDTDDFAGGPCKTLLVGVAGTANVVQDDGVVRENVPLQAGYNPIVAKRVNTGGTASDIWALYAS